MQYCGTCRCGKTAGVGDHETECRIAYIIKSSVEGARAGGSISMFDILRGMARFLLIGFAVLGAALLYLTLLDRFLHKRFPRIGMFLSAPVVALFFMLPVVALIGAYGELLGLRSLEPFVLIVAYVLTVAFLIWSAATKSNDADSSK